MSSEASTTEFVHDLRNAISSMCLLLGSVLISFSLLQGTGKMPRLGGESGGGLLWVEGEGGGDGEQEEGWRRRGNLRSLRDPKETKMSAMLSERQ